MSPSRTQNVKVVKSDCDDRSYCDAGSASDGSKNVTNVPSLMTAQLSKCDVDIPHDVDVEFLSSSADPASLLRLSMTLDVCVGCFVKITVGWTGLIWKLFSSIRNTSRNKTFPAWIRFSVSRFALTHRSHKNSTPLEMRSMVMNSWKIRNREDH